MCSPLFKQIFLPLKFLCIVEERFESCDVTSITLTILPNIHEKSAK